MATVLATASACSLPFLAACSSSDTSVATGAVPTTVDIAGSSDAGELRLLTYNVGGLPAEISASRPDRNLPLISPLLEPYDLVVTQEDYDWWVPGGLAAGLDFVNYHGRLRAATTHEYQSPEHPGLDAVGVDPADRPDLQLGDGLGTLSRLPASGDVRVAWPDCFGGFNQDDGGKADCLAVKGFQVTTIEVGGAEVLLYNVNTEAGSNPRDQQLQAANFELLAADIAERADGRAVIVAGDSNLRLDDAHPASGDGQDRRIWDRFLEAAGLRDACTGDGCADGEVIERVAYRSSDDLELEVAAHRLRTDRFVDADGEPLAERPPLEVAFAWRAT
jgi:hypothetical protein